MTEREEAAPELPAAPSEAVAPRAAAPSEAAATEAAASEGASPPSSPAGDPPLVEGEGAATAVAAEASRARADVTWRWGALIVALYLVVQLLGLRSSALTDDDDFYIPAGASYAAWLGRAVTGKTGAFSKEQIDQAFDPNHEHPPFAKYVFGIAQSALSGVLGPTDSARVGTVLFSTAIAGLLVLLAVVHLGRRRGLFVGGVAALALLLMPRFYFHSHAATLDVPVAAMYLAGVALALLGERSTKAAILAGPVFGLASATKLNAPFLLIGYAAYVVLTRRGRWSVLQAGVSPRRAVALPTVPLAAASMVVLGPIVFLAAWPWLWHDTFSRIVAYVTFHLNHYGIYFLYFGQVFEKNPFAPWHAPFVMAATTVPLATSGLACVGLGAAVPLVRARITRTDGADDDDRRAGDLVLTALIHAALTIAVVAFSGGAKYGGEKLFMPFFPFWALLAGLGAWWLWERLGALAGAWRWGRVVVLGAAFASVLALSLKFSGYALSEYNALAGGLRGATAVGFERQYYDLAFRDLVAWLDAEAPKNARVHFLPNNWEYVRTYNWYRRANELRQDIQVVQSENQADWIVITHERRFARYSDDLQRYRTHKVLKEKVVDGTPIWSVVEARGP